MPRMTSAPLRALVPASLDNVLVAAALILGSIVRLIPVLGSDFPINDGGLFAAMIDDLVRHGPSLPRVVDYNGGDIPFAYPRDESLQERPEFGELRSHIRELVMNEYRAQQAQMRPASFSE